MYIKINQERFQVEAYSGYVGSQIPDAIAVDVLTPSKYHSLKNNYQDFTGAEQWEITDLRRHELIAELSTQIDKKTREELANGFAFENNIFPLTGDLYAQNMSAASAYFIRQQTGGRGLYAIDGTFAAVADVAGLIALGDDTATSICLSGVDEKSGLQLLTTEELIALYNGE